MASYRPFVQPPPQSNFPPAPPSQNPAQPPPLPPQSQGGNPYSQNWGYGSNDGPSYSQNYTQMHPNSSFQHGNYGSSAPQHYRGPPANQLPPHPPPLQQQQQQPQQYSYLPPPPPPDSSYPPPPPQNLPSQPAPAPMYYPSQFSQYNQQPLQPLEPPPPPPPTSPPPSSSIPPPPPPSQPPSPPPPPSSSAPAPSQNKESVPAGERVVPKDRMGSGWHEHRHSNQGAPPKQHKNSAPPLPSKKPVGPSGRIETEEERRLRKKREMEKQKQDEKNRHQLKESQSKVLQKTQMISSGTKAFGSVSGSHMGDRRTAPLLSGERNENRLKKPTTFLCKLKFRNELPDPTAQPKLLSLKRDRDRFTKYKITSLEKMHKPQLYVEPDLGIPLDLLDLSVYNPPKGERLPLDPEDEELLRDDEPITPIKKDSFKKKDRPTDKGVSWLVKTQYISPLSMESSKQSLSAKQAKELRDSRESNILQNLNSRERKIREIEASFEACKSRPVHATNKKLQPVEILPLLPDFERYDDQFVVATFDNAPTADSEIYNKLDKSVRDAHESQAIMKSYVAKSSDSAKPDKFLAYMAPSIDELSKDIYDEDEDVSYTWVREYHWDVRGDDADDPTTFLVAFGESEARYVPLPTKLILRKKRAREGKTTDEVEHFPAPSRVTVRRRSTVSVSELKESGGYLGGKGSASNSKGRRLHMEDGIGRSERGLGDAEMDHSSGAEYEDSE